VRDDAHLNSRFSRGRPAAINTPPAAFLQARETAVISERITTAALPLLVLACLRKDETFAELIAGFGINTATAWRYLTGTVALLAARAPKLR
jgi:hypothetical protein